MMKIIEFRGVRKRNGIVTVTTNLNDYSDILFRRQCKLIDVRYKGGKSKLSKEEIETIIYRYPVMSNFVFRELDVGKFVPKHIYRRVRTVGGEESKSLTMKRWRARRRPLRYKRARICQ